MIEVGETVVVISNRHRFSDRYNFAWRKGKLVSICPHKDTGELVACVKLFEYFSPFWFDLRDIRPEF